MTSLRRFIVLLVVLVCARVSIAQTVPTVTQPLPARAMAMATGAASVDLRTHFGLPDVTGSVFQVDTVVGRFNLELFDDTPITTANFLAYVNAGRYAGTYIHRVVPGFVVQLGGYFPKLPLTDNHIETFAPIQNEFRHSNVRGTVAMAKLSGDPNSATSEWFINLANNNAAGLDVDNGGYTVFARVIGNGMPVVDSIAILPRAGEIPIHSYNPEQPTTLDNLVVVNDITPLPIYPPAERSVLTFTAESSNNAIVTAAIEGSTLVLTPKANGAANVTVRATDTNNATAESTFTVTVSGSITIQTTPQAQHIEPNASATLSVTAQGTGALSYQWRKDGEPIAGATGSSYTIANASAADMGFYAVTVTSGAEAVTTDYVGVTVNVPGRSRLVNVSTRGRVAPDKPLTPGFVMRGNGTKNLVIRAIGPTLTQYNVSGVLADPRMQIVPLGETTVVKENDDWNVTTAADVAALIETSVRVGAFALPVAGSKDAATLAALPVSSSSGYTVGIRGAGTGAAASGVALAEIYDADPLDSPVSLVNVSTLGEVTADGLTPGFVIGGTASKRLLIRAVGPTLEAYDVEGELADPQIVLFPLGKDFEIARNNDWGDGGQAVALEAAFAAAGAFLLPSGSKDAAVVVQLPPGGYTAVVTGVGGATGQGLVEVYDLDP